MYTIQDLFDLSHTRAAAYLAGFTYPWEALAGIGDLIRRLGPTLEPDFAQRAPEVWVHKTAVVAPTAYLGAPCIIGAGTEVRHGAFIRGSALVGDNCVVGNSVELKNVILFDGVQTPHYNYVGDSILGYKAHMGAGSITSNVKSDKTLVVVRCGAERAETGRKKVGAMLGDHVEIGCNSVLNPGTVVGRSSRVYPLSSVRGTVPADSIYKRGGDIAAQREREVRHDVMAHVYTYGKAAPSAAGIIHLGATSCYVTDNADLIIYREGLRYLRGELLAVVANLSKFAEQYKATPTLGYTHYQPAQPVTVGKRATLWMQDLLADVEELDHVLSTLKFLGCRGTTGTEASFMDLFDGGEAKIDEMNRRLAASFGFKECFPVCGQTYPRKVDSRILSCLSGIAQSAYRMANDIRLLQHDRQLEEPFETDQIGSSAMAYKRNPMRCERICSLSRYLMADAMNAPMTASVQWMERTLDDSANRRIALPEGFLCADAVLRLCQNVTAGLHVNEAIVDRTLREYLPFLATEDLMMEAVKRGGDRQQLHEIIRRHSMAATARMKEGLPCDLLDRLAGDPAFGLSRGELEQLMEPQRYIGRCPQQVRQFLDACAPLLRQAQGADGDIRV